MRRRRSVGVPVLLAAVPLLGSLALAQGLPKLPADVALAMGDNSPGKVVFSHKTHVDAARPECTTCHPTLFRLVDPHLARGAGRLSHAQMEKGAHCGSCHNGKDARGFDDCSMCHRSG